VDWRDGLFILQQGDSFFPKGQACRTVDQMTLLPDFHHYKK
jgi:hypothetical protein